MCENSPYQIKFAYPDATVTVKDLWEVYPELASKDEVVFAKQIRDAADFNRKHEALHLLRDRFDEAAIDAGIDYAVDSGATWPDADDNPGQSNVVTLSPSDRSFLAEIADSLKTVADLYREDDEKQA